MLICPENLSHLKTFFLTVVSVLLIQIQALAGTITVTSPNGGESWNSCTPKNITWNATSTSGYYNIDYSLDNGATWVGIATSYQTNAGSFTWNLPNVSSVNCLVRVTDAQSTSTSDVSNSVFVINGALIVLSPNGGENFITGTTQNIIYSYLSGVVTNIKIEYTHDSGLNWNTIISSTLANGSYAWVIPNTPSSSVKVKLTDLADPSCKMDTSNTAFTITSNLTVLTPNGGESLQAVVGSQGTTVIMNNAPERLNTASFYDDGGLGSNYSNNSFTKTIRPDFPTNKLKVTFQSYALETGDQLFVYDGLTTSAPLLTTISSSSNTIVSFQATNSSGALTFRYLSDGDNQQSSGWDAFLTSVGTSTYNITWNIVGTSKFFDIDYSIDNGANWTRVISNYYSLTGTFPWQVPNTPSTQARVRVRDAKNNSINDISNSSFTIVQATPFFLLTSPNGSENLYPSTFYDITWSSAFAGQNVALEYSTNNGSSWNNIIPSTPNITESYSWLVPNTPSTQCLVRVKDAANASASDVSNAVFTIRPHITVTAPNGGESGARCSAFNITWAAGGTSGSYKLDYSTDGGTTWVQIATNVSNACTGNSCTYGWTLPNVLTTQLKVRVSDVADATKTDASDGNMSVTLPPSPVTLLSPNGGQSWVTGTTQNITYTYGSGTTQVSLEYSVDNGQSWSTIANNVTANGSYAWVVPNTPSVNALVKVTGNQFNGCDYDISNAVFTIASSVVVTAPNGGESWQAMVGAQGTSINMSNATVVLNTSNYYDNGGASNNFTATNYTQTLVPDNPLNKLRIYIDSWGVSCNRLLIYDGPTTSSPLVGDLSGNGTNWSYQSTHSSGTLTIRMLINNGGCIDFGWRGYITSVGTTTRNITWNIVGTSKRFDLDYSTDGGTAWTRIVSDLPNTTGVYGWQVPNTPSTQARVRVRDAGNNAIVDSSNANFTITAASPVIIVNYPNGGERLYSGQSKDIEWRASTFNVDFVKIEYSLDNGITWGLVTASASNSGIFFWVIPEVNTPKPNCRIRISKVSEPQFFDLSDAVFEIRPWIYLTSPNGNSSLFQSCTQSSVTWSGNIATSCKIELSIDSGATWTTLNSNFSVSSFDNNYSWLIPNTPSTRCLVKVTDNANPAKYDVSDSVFTIRPSIVLNYPAYGGILQAGSTVQINWTSYLTSAYFNLDYSIDNGQNWINIGTNLFVPTYTYNWVVPNVSSNAVKVRVTDFTSSCKTTQSANPFTISASAATVNLTSPNSGTFNSCSTLNLTWTATGVSNVNLQFSSNGGLTWSMIASNIAASLGTYAWTVPNISTTQGLIRVVDALNPSNLDISNNVFTITQTLVAAITSSGSPTFCAGQTITLTSSATSGNVWSNGATTNSIVVSASGDYYVTVTQGNCVARSSTISVVVNPLPASPVISANGPLTTCAGTNLVLQSNQATGNTWSPGGQTTQAITVSTSGTYLVNYTNSNGCTSVSNAVIVNIIGTSTPPSVTSNSPVYIGGQLNLAASNIQGASYSWTGPNGFTSSLQNPTISNVQLNMTGTYSVIATVQGCQTAAQSVSVNVLNSTAATLQGYFRHPLGDSIPFVNARLSGSTQHDTISTIRGKYESRGFAGGSYVLTPAKNNDINKSNGVTTLDIIGIQKHLLNRDTLNSPYKIIAADVNSSNSVTTLDIVYVRRLILGIDTTFPGNKLWSFVPSDYTFPNPINPFPYPSTRSYTSLTTSTNQNFVGVKLGDITWDWNPSQLKGGSVDSVILYTEFVKESATDTFKLPIRVLNFSGITGIQFGLKWDPRLFELSLISKNTLPLSFNLSYKSSGYATFIWNHPSNAGVNLIDSTLIFELTFIKKTNSASSPRLELFNEKIPAEAYDADTNPFGVVYREFKKQLPQLVSVIGESIAVFPNPTSGLLVIRTDLTSLQQAVITIQSSLGNKLYSFVNTFNKGVDRVQLDLSARIPGLKSGIYFVTVSLGGKLRTFKIVYSQE